MIYAYPCVITPVDDGSLVATFPDVPEAITGGASRSEALAQAEDALATALAGYVHEKWDIPSPSEAVAGHELVAVPAVIAAKLALYSAMRAQRITKVELASRLDISESAVRKLANPDHRSHVGQVQKALRAVGRTIKVEPPPERDRGTDAPRVTRITIVAPPNALRLARICTGTSHSDSPHSTPARRLPPNRRHKPARRQKPMRLRQPLR